MPILCDDHSSFISVEYRHVTKNQTGPDMSSYRNVQRCDNKRGVIVGLAMTVYIVCLPFCVYSTLGVNHTISGAKLQARILYFILISIVFLLISYLLFGWPGVVADILNPLTP